MHSVRECEVGVSLSYFFSVKGRTSRKEYWFRYLLPAAVIVALAVGADEVFVVGPLKEGAPPLRPFLPIAYLSLLVPSVVVPIKRLHDRGMSGWWMLVGHSSVVLAFAAYWFYTNAPGAATANPLTNLLVASGAITSFAAWLFVAINVCLLKGQPHDNRYGPNPLAIRVSNVPKPIGQGFEWNTSLHSLASERPRSSGSWIGRHWRGDLPLWISYWVVGILGNLVAYLAAEFFVQAFSVDQGYEPASILAALVLILSTVVVIACWQLIGIWRSASKYNQRQRNERTNSPWGTLAKFVVVMNVVGFVAGLNRTAVPQIAEMYNIVFHDDPGIPPYAIRIINNAAAIEIAGGFKYGLSNDFEKVLRSAPDVGVVHLDSPGGRLGEAEKVYKTIKKNNLATYVPRECSSACTVAFAGGSRRWLGPEGKLGFHGGSFPGLTESELLPANEIQRRVWRDRGVSSDFIEKAISTPSDEMWFPTAGELEAAGVISGVVKAAQAEGNDPESLGLIPIVPPRKNDPESLGLIPVDPPEPPATK